MRFISGARARHVGGPRALWVGLERGGCGGDRIDRGPTGDCRAAVALFRGPPAPAAGEAFTPAFDVASDGRFLMRTSSVTAGADVWAEPELIAVFNWSVELAELVPLD